MQISSDSLRIRFYTLTSFFGMKKKNQIKLARELGPFDNVRWTAINKLWKDPRMFLFAHKTAETGIDLLQFCFLKRATDWTLTDKVPLPKKYNHMYIT